MIHDVQYDEYIGADVPNTQHTIGLIPDTRYTTCLIHRGRCLNTQHTIDLIPDTRYVICLILMVDADVPTVNTIDIMNDTQYA